MSHRHLLSYTGGLQRRGAKSTATTAVVPELDVAAARRLGVGEMTRWPPAREAGTGAPHGSWGVHLVPAVVTGGEKKRAWRMRSASRLAGHLVRLPHRAVSEGARRTSGQRDDGRKRWRPLSSLRPRAVAVPLSAREGGREGGRERWCCCSSTTSGTGGGWKERRGRGERQRRPAAGPCHQNCLHSKS
uniref:Uncharacterized protein n=1 Tax=Setaria italica TaxID=4555 RepID=K3YJT5_SETIT